MTDIKKKYGEYFEKKMGEAFNLYPSEWVVRTFLGKYTGLGLSKAELKGKKILDHGCGYGRNIPFLSDCGFVVHGTEISNEIVQNLILDFKRRGVLATFEVGENGSLPHENNYFDYLISFNSCYYLADNGSIRNTFLEFFRVLRKDGVLFFSIPMRTGHHLLDTATLLNDGTSIINDDITGVRKGCRFKSIKDKREIYTILDGLFYDIRIGEKLENYYGLKENMFFVTCKKL